MIEKFNVFGILYRGETPFKVTQYKIVFEDNSLKNLGDLLTTISYDIISDYTK